MFKATANILYLTVVLCPLSLLSPPSLLPSSLLPLSSLPPSLLPPSSLCLSSLPLSSLPPTQTSSTMRMVQMSIGKTRVLFFLSGGSSLTEHARWLSPLCAGTRCTRTCLQWGMAPVSLATRGLWKETDPPSLTHTHTHTHTAHPHTHTQMTLRARVLVWFVSILSRTRHTLSEL